MKGTYKNFINYIRLLYSQEWGNTKVNCTWWRHQKQQPVRYQSTINAGCSAHEEVLSAWQRRSGLCPWRRPLNSQGSTQGKGTLQLPDVDTATSSLTHPVNTHIYIYLPTFVYVCSPFKRDIKTFWMWQKNGMFIGFLKIDKFWEELLK